MRVQPSLILNKTPSKGAFRSLLSNIAANAQPRQEQMEGRDYLVVPCVMMTEGVHTGVGAPPLYYSAEELAANVQTWNMKPVVVYHPEKHGQNVSACSPDIVTEYKVGVLMNTTFASGKLKTECWLEEDRLKEVDDRVLNSILEGQMMEVSTGVFVDQVNEAGEWNGEAYEALAVNQRPDHLAILPDQIGACSIQDGAGLLRNAAADKTPIGLMAQSFLMVVNEMSHDEIWRELNDKVRINDDMDTWVEQVYDDWFIYHAGDKLYYQMYSMKDDVIKLEGVRQQAEKSTQYKLGDGTIVGNAVAQTPATHRNSKEIQMDPEEMIDLLISNEQTPWTEEDRGALSAMDAPKLEFMVNSTKKPEEPAKPETKAPVTPVAPATPAQPVDNADVTVEQYIEQAPEGMRDMLGAGLVAHNAQKQELVTKITSNKRNTFSAEVLNTKSLEELQGLAALAEEPAATKSPHVPHYGGCGEPKTPATNAKGDDEPLTMAEMDFSSK